MFDVITMGSNTMDNFASTENTEIIDIRKGNQEEELIAYPLGSKVIINELHFDIGGNGVNAAVAFSRLGLNTAYIGKIGGDNNGDTILEKLNQEKIEFVGARGEKTGFSVILDCEACDDRTILTYKGANNNLHYDELNHEKLNSKWLYVSSMLGESFNTVQRVAHELKEKGCKIAFNPSKTISRKGFDFLKNLLEKTDILILNDEEAKDLVGDGPVEELLKRLRDSGIQIVVITLGSEGVMALEGNTLYRAKPTPDRPILETTGAGDSFSSAFVAGRMQDKDIETCIKMGMLNAESVIAHYGAHNKLLNMHELNEKLENDHRELIKEEIS